MNSALCLGKNLIRSGTTLFVCAPYGPKINDFLDLGMKVVACDALAKRFPRNLMSVPSLISIILKENIDVVHAMDYQSLYPGFLAASLLGRKLLFTKAGGETPEYIIPLETNVVVYSGELLEGMQAQYPYLFDRFHLIKARIDTDLFHPIEQSISEPAHRPVKIFMAMRLEESKRPWLETAITGITDLAGKNPSFVFLLAGNGGLGSEIEAQVERINRRYNRDVILLLGGISSIAGMNKLYNDADLIVGHGRGILEAMACGKPVVAIGKHGEATIVRRDTVEQISYYNFSGRHLDHHPELSQNFNEVLETLLKHPEKREELKDFSLEYIKCEYAADIGAKHLQKLYGVESKPIYYRYAYILRWLFDEVRTRITRYFSKQQPH